MQILRSLSLLALAVVLPACAPDEASVTDALTQTTHALELPVGTARDYAVDEHAVFAYSSNTTQAGLFRFPLDGGPVQFIDGIDTETATGRRRQVYGSPQRVGNQVYFVVATFEGETIPAKESRELMRVATTGGAPEKVIELPKGHIVVGHSVIYVVTSAGEGSNDARISVIELADPARKETVVSTEEFARDFVTVGDSLFWRSGWAGLSYNGLWLRSYSPNTGGPQTIDLGEGRQELQRVLTDGQKVYAFGGFHELWSFDVATKVVSKLPSLRERMNVAGVSFCGDEYPYGFNSSAVTSDSLYAYCTNWDDRSKRFILAFPLDGRPARTLHTVPTTRAWYLRASASQLFWLEKTGGDIFALRMGPL